MPIAASQPVAILFDIDGTLIDSGGAGGGALLHALREEFRIADPSAVRLHGRTDLGIMTELLQANQIEATEDHLRRLRERYFEVLPDELARAMDASCLAVCTGGFTRAELHQAGARRVVDDLSDTENLLAWIFQQEELSGDA